MQKAINDDDESAMNTILSNANNSKDWYATNPSKALKRKVLSTAYIKITENILVNNNEFAGLGTSSYPFAGNLDGGNNTITFNINKTQAEDQNYFGLIAFSKSGKKFNIQNVQLGGSITLDFGNVTAGDIYAGALIGNGSDGTLIHHNKSAVKLTVNISRRKEDSEASQTVYVGGIFGGSNAGDGSLHGGFSDLQTLDGASVTVNQPSGRRYTFWIGGISGRHRGDGLTTNNMINRATVNVNTMTDGGTQVGGITGSSWATARQNVWRNYGNINVTGTGNVYVGGGKGYDYHALNGRFTETDWKNYGKITVKQHTGGYNGWYGEFQVGGVKNETANSQAGGDDMYNYGDIEVILDKNGTSTLFVGGLSANTRRNDHRNFNYGNIKVVASRNPVYVGGVFGFTRYNEYDTVASTINYEATDLYNEGNITVEGNGGDVYAGGITAYGGGTTAYSGKGVYITRAVNHGNIKVTGSPNQGLIGGVMGWLQHYGALRNVVNTGDISVDGTFNGATYVGGISGLLQYENALVDHGYATGDINITNSRSNLQVGGIAGYVNAASITNSVVDGSTLTANGKTANVGNQLGGLIGAMYDTCTVTGNITNAKLVQQQTGGTKNLGGLVGLHSSGIAAATMSNNYFSKDKTGTANSYQGATRAGVTGVVLNTPMDLTGASATAYTLSPTSGTNPSSNMVWTTSNSGVATASGQTVTRVGNGSATLNAKYRASVTQPTETTYTDSGKTYKKISGSSAVSHDVDFGTINFTSGTQSQPTAVTLAPTTATYNLTAGTFNI